MSESVRSDPIQQARDQWVAQGWEAAAPGLAVVAALVRTQQIFVSRLEAELRPIGLSLARFEVLMQLNFSRSGGMTLTELRHRLQVMPGAITNVIDRLERDGRVRRETLAEDGRVTVATITNSGRALARNAALVVNERVYEAMNIPVEDMDELYRRLQDIRHRIGDIDDRR